MLWKRKISYSIVLSVILFSLVFLASHLPGLGRDEINPDAVNWHYRSEQFMVGLKTGQLEKTYQHYHPGVTLMWIMGPAVEFVKQLTPNKIYNQFTFYTFHITAKYSLIITQLFLNIFLIFLLSRIISIKKAIIFLSALNLEPFFLGNSRLLHMDVLFTLLAFSSLVLFYIFLKEQKIYWLVLSAFFCAMTFLTRSLGVGLFVYLLFGGFIYYWLSQKNIASLSSKLILFFTVFIAAVFIFFPALWRSPANTLIDIFSEGRRIGLEKGHDQIFFNRESTDPGVFFYFIVLVLKVSPFFIFGMMVYTLVIIKLLVVNRKKINMHLKNKSLIGFNTFIAIFYAGYFAVLTFSSKKLDRYMVFLFPPLYLYAIYGYYYIFQNIKKEYNKYFYLMIFLMVGYFVIQPVITLYPYYFTYTNPMLGSSYSANKIIAQKPFGIGIFEVKDKIMDKYGIDTEVGFIDTKPIKSIFPNSQVHDIRVDGPGSYDVLILAVNEDFPEKVVDNDVKFIKDDSIFINGLEYWRFYVKQNN